MNKLKRKIDVFNVLSKKSEISVEAIRKSYSHHKKQLREAENTLLSSTLELNTCSEKISEGSLEEIDVDAIKRLNEYCLKLSRLVNRKTQNLSDVQQRVRETKVQLDKELLKGKAFSKVIENVSSDYTQCVQKNFDKNVEDIWLSRRNTQ